MSNHKLSVGSIAKICKIEPQPQLNGLFVVVEECLRPDCYVVMLLDRPTVPPKHSPLYRLRILLRNLDVVTKISFSDRFPDAPALTGTWLEVAAETRETIWDVSNCSHIDGNNESILIALSCSILGNRQRGARCCPVPASIIDCGSLDSIVEIDSIHFDSRSSVKCRRSANITFRKCIFSCAGTGCVVGGYEQSTSVVFENCQFECSAGAAVSVHKNGHVTLAYCEMHNLQDAVCVGPGGSAVLIHCTISDVTGAAVTVLPRGERLEMVNCTVQRAPTGLRVANSNAFVLRGCLISEVNCIALCSVRSATIQDSNIANCTIGLLVEAGKSSVTVSNCQFTSIQKKAIVVKDVASGSLNVDNCKLSKRFRTALSYEAGSMCTVPRTINNPTHSALLPAVAAGDGLQQRGMLHLLRIKKKADTGRVLCFACDKVEPAGEKFKVCGKCGAVCYCSRACQVRRCSNRKRMILL